LQTGVETRRVFKKPHTASSCYRNAVSVPIFGAFANGDGNRKVQLRLQQQTKQLKMAITTVVAANDNSDQTAIEKKLLTNNNVDKAR
jgi:hypothetical protein